MSNALNFEFADELQINAKMKVVGVGGAGGNAVDRMILSGLTGPEFISINTDAQALDRTLASRKLQIGKQLTKGLGVGADPNKGREAAEQDAEMITEVLRDADLVFITAGMGGGTGTGAAPKVAEIARSMGILTVAIVTKPFAFEGNRRMAVADLGVKALREQVDTLVVIPNQRLLNVVDATTTFLDSFKRADSVLTDATRGIADLISIPGIVNLDFADVKAIMSGSGDALMGIGIAVGEERGKKAAQMAIHSPLLEDVSIAGAQGVLVNITGSPDMTLFEVSEAASEVTNAAGDNANVIFGAVIDENIGEEIRVTVIATGFGRSSSAPLPKLPDLVTDFIPKNTTEIQIPTITRLEKISGQVRADPPKGNGNRIHLEVNVEEDPPTDFGIPTFLRKNGHKQ